MDRQIGRANDMKRIMISKKQVGKKGRGKYEMSEKSKR